MPPGTNFPPGKPPPGNHWFTVGRGLADNRRRASTRGWHWTSVSATDDDQILSLVAGWGVIEGTGWLSGAGDSASASGGWGSSLTVTKSFGCKLATSGTYCWAAAVAHQVRARAYSPISDPPPVWSACFPFEINGRKIRPDWSAAAVTAPPARTRLFGFFGTRQNCLHEHGYRIPCAADAGGMHATSSRLLAGISLPDRQSLTVERRLETPDRAAPNFRRV